MAFPAFTGVPIDQPTKTALRAQLVDLVCSTTSSKIRKSASYVIVQIAAADFPDEWPSLLADLYARTTDYAREPAMLGGLLVFTDLFDDLITEDQFWGGTGAQLIAHLVDILRHGVSAPVKSACINLYRIVFNILQSPEAFESPQRKRDVYSHVHQAMDLLASLLEASVQATKSAAVVAVDELAYRSALYRLLHLIIGTFNKKIAPGAKLAVAAATALDLSMCGELHHQLALENVAVSFAESDDDTSTVVDNILSDLMLTVQLLQHSFTLGSVTSMPTFFHDLLMCSLLPNDTIAVYDAEINEFISDTTGLSVKVTPRDSVNDFLSELNSQDSNAVFELVVTGLANVDDWRHLEAHLWILEGLFINEDSDLTTALNLVDLLNKFTSFIGASHPLVTARVFLLLPKFFEKFQSTISMSSFGVKTFLEMVTFAVNAPVTDENMVIKASAVVSCTTYGSVIDLTEEIAQADRNTVQANVFTLISSLIPDSEDDGLPILLEALTASIDFDRSFASKFTRNSESVIDMILKISFKDPANVQLIIDASECLKSLLKSIGPNEYIASCERSLPLLCDIMNQSFVGDTVEYSSKLDLSLDLLSIIIDSAPSSDGNGFPIQIFNYTFPILKKTLLVAVDDQILQSGGAVFNNLIQRAKSCFSGYTDPDTKESGIQSLLGLVSKFLSPQLSDKAAMNCGTIVSSLINNFRDQLGDDFLTQILTAATERLIIAKEVITIENLMMLFCNLILLSPESMIGFLVSNIKMKDPKTQQEKSGLELVLPIWFQSFEVTRGFEKIRQNVLALAKIFSLGDERVAHVIVNGEIIPYDGDQIITRSKAKSMPERYTQVSAALKIIKLLVSELDFQRQQPNPDDYLPETDPIVDADDNEEGWEDLEDVGVPNFEKLKSYVDSDDDEKPEENTGSDLKSILEQFFKECATRNLGNFQSFYEQLDDSEKRIITESIVF